MTIRGRIVVAGVAQGEVLASAEPLSFWGGYDQRTGEIIDRRHPLSGCIAAGKILALPSSRGSSTTTAILLESVKLGTAPAAIITNEVDRFFALASIVAEELYGAPIPLVALEEADFDALSSGQHVQIFEDGIVEVQ
jgi:hypothetical protein